MNQGLQGLRVFQRSDADVDSQALREAIVLGTIEVGAPLRQDHIASEFGVSHIPVREALRELVTDGLAVFIQNRGVLVSECPWTLPGS
jgi:DNA-binding GntR family transcriptional regulator